MKFTVIMTALALISSSALGMPTEQNGNARIVLCKLSCILSRKPDCYNICIGRKHPLTKSQDIVNHPLIFRELRKNSPLASNWG
jgi:hypothetical protein